MNLNGSDGLLPDEWFVKVFRGPGSILNKDLSKIDWAVVGDFQVQGRFLVKLIGEIQAKMDGADDDYLYSAAEQLYVAMECIRQIIVVSTDPSYIAAIEKLFEGHFGDKHIDKRLYDELMGRWLEGKKGQHQVGYNYYNVVAGNFYYKDRFGKWFEVDGGTVFDLKPKKKPAADKKLTRQLNKEYEETRYDKIISLWNKKEFKGTLPDDFLKFEPKEASPEEYAKFSEEHIKELVENPVSIEELERWGGNPGELEDLVKIGAYLFDFMSKKAKDGDHTLYLLRDCMVFYELSRALELMTGKSSSADQLLIGRKLFDSEHRKWGYWVVTNEMLYQVFRKYPGDFDAFYKEYSRLMDLFVANNPTFAKIVASLSTYIEKHIRIGKRNVVFDIGFTGTINLLTRYVIDNHINQKIETEIELFSGAPWLKQVFGKRHATDYFFLLHHIQFMARSEHMCFYKPDSLKEGEVRIIMGSEEWQHKAAVELIVLVMVALINES